MKAMILAAGQGTRLGSLTKHCPKPLLYVGEHRLIEYQLLALSKSGFKEVIINIAYMADEFPKHLGDGKRYQINITYSREPVGALETGGGIIQALPLLGEQPFLVTSADLYTDFSYASLKHISLSEDKPAHLVLTHTSPDHTQGDFGLSPAKQDSPVAYGQINLRPPKFIYANIGVFHPSLFHPLPALPISLGDIIRQKLQHDLITGQCLTSGVIWRNISCPEDLQQLEEWMKKKKDKS